VIANHAKMVPPGKSVRYSSFMKYKNSGPYELSDRYKIDPFTQKVSRSRSPNLIKQEALCVQPEFIAERVVIQQSNQSSVNHSPRHHARKALKKKSKEGKSQNELATSQYNSSAKVDQQMMMNKIQLKEATLRQIGPFVDARKQITHQNNTGRAVAVNNDDLEGLQNPDDGKEEGRKKFKVVRHLESITPGGTYRIRD
jgi:hypothetical protein